MSARPLIGQQRQRFTSIVGVAEQRVAPRVGKLKLGIKENPGSSKEHPKEIDYFRCVPDDGFSAEEQRRLTESFAHVYGERAAVLHETYFPSDDLDFVIPHPLQVWGKSEAGPKLLCEGNGVDAVRLNYETGAWEPRACCHVAECDWYNAKRCGMKARLRVFLPLVTVSGYWQVDTTSQIGVGNILEVANHMLSLLGHLRGIPFTLSREKEPVPFEGKVTPHWILHLRAPNVTLPDFKALIAQRGQISAGEPIEPDPDTDLPEELVPASEQEPAVDPELLKKIKDGFDILDTSPANRAASLHQFKGREAELLTRILAKIDTSAPASTSEESLGEV